MSILMTDSKRLPTGPINIKISENIHLSANAPNTITVLWRNDFHKRLVISAYLVDKLTCSQLIQRVKAKGIRPKEFTIALSTLHALFISNFSFFSKNSMLTLIHHYPIQLRKNSKVMMTAELQQLTCVYHSCAQLEKFVCLHRAGKYSF